MSNDSEQAQERDYVENLREPEWDTLSGRPIDLQRLLRWGISHSTRNEDAPETDPARQLELENREPIDPKWIDVILGKSDMQRMKECIENIMNKNINQDEAGVRVAYDELELLIEDIDNAKDFVKSNLWLYLLPKIRHEDERIRIMTLWILGTMVQNNPYVKKAYGEKNILPQLLELIQHDSSLNVRSKAVYTLSGFLKHNKPALQEFMKQNGVQILYQQLKEFPTLSGGNSTTPESEMYLSKIIFMLHNLTVDDLQMKQELLSVGASVVNDAMHLCDVFPKGEDLHSKIFEFLMLLELSPNEVQRIRRQLAVDFKEFGDDFTSEQVIEKFMNK